MAQTVGERIRNMRGLRSQRELAAASGIGESYISRLEHGHIKPGHDMLIRLSKALGCDVNALMGDA